MNRKVKLENPPQQHNHNVNILCRINTLDKCVTLSCLCIIHYLSFQHITSYLKVWHLVRWWCWGEGLTLSFREAVIYAGEWFSLTSQEILILFFDKAYQLFYEPLIHPLVILYMRNKHDQIYHYVEWRICQAILIWGCFREEKYSCKGVHLCNLHTWLIEWIYLLK